MQLNLKRGPQDWHVADIKCCLEKKGWSLARLAEQHGYNKYAGSQALLRQWPALEKIIADAIGVHPGEIWPSRYDAKGNTTRQRQGRPGAGRPRNAATGRA